MKLTTTILILAGALSAGTPPPRPGGLGNEVSMHPRISRVTFKQRLRKLFRRHKRFYESRPYVPPVRIRY